MLGTKGGDDVASRQLVGKPDAAQEAAAAHLDNHLPMLFRNAVQCGMEDSSTPVDVVKEARRRDLVEYHLGDSHGQRVAGKGGAVRSRGHGIADLGAGNHRTDREAAAKPLRHGDDVGPDAGCLVGEERSGTTDARLHLVGNHKHAELIGGLPDAAKILVMRVTGAALALDRLDHYCSDMVAKRVAKRVEIAERDMFEAGGHRSEACPVGRLVGRRQHPQRAPMEGSGGAENRHAVRLAAFMRGAARDLDRGFIRFGAGIAEIDLI